jgi:uncharacterized protein (TIGR03000 family)
MKKFVVLGAVSLATMLVALPTPAHAWSIGRIGAFSLRGIGVGSFRLFPGRVFSHRWSDRYYYYPYVGSYSYPYAAYYPSADVSYSYPYAAYYPQEEVVDVNAATIRMHVRSDARVWFEGKATSQSGPDRTFVSPALTPGHEYVYHIRVQWDDSGKAVERNRDVTLHAGDRVNLSVDE